MEPPFLATALITHPDCLLHDMGKGHRDTPRRLRAINDVLIEARLFDLLARYGAPRAAEADIVNLVHLISCDAEVRRMSYAWRAAMKAHPDQRG
jgi:acetoin utilization deacetylase AcuC-like enzyme